MNAALILWQARIREKGAESAQAVVEKTWKQFGVAIKRSRLKRNLSLRTFAKRLKITGQMLNYLETGQRRWTFERAELAVKLLTRKEEWPD
jgi:ribosome-binding protein aMBF1 (putative translation factor)